MSATLALPPAAPAPPRRASALRRAARLRHTSPGRLQLILVALLTLGLLTGLATGLTANAAATGTTDLGKREQPLLVEAEVVYSSLAEADTTAAQAFLAGGLEPRELTERYEAALARAHEALTSAARRTPENSAADAAVSALATGISRYAALVATARAANRQGLPVGAAYLSAASTLNVGDLQQQARRLQVIAEREIGDGYDEARSSWWLLLLLVLLAGLGAALLYAQVYLSRATRRTFNVPLVAATVLAALLALGAGGVFVNQRVHLDNAAEHGSAPMARIAESRILVLRERTSELLALAGRAGGGDYETEFDRHAERLGDARGLLAPGRQEDRLGILMSRAHDGHGAYVRLHDEVRELDDGGDYDKAVKLATGQRATATFEGLTKALGDALDDRRSVFTDEIGDAGRGLGLLTVLGPLLALAVCVLAVFGIRARLKEYQ